MRCTCGAYPPEDARFCHKCGRPLYESELIEEQPEPESVPKMPPPLPSVREAAINFGNKTAVGVSVMAAAVTLFLLILLLLAVPSGVLAPLLFCAGGFLAATLYTRASGETLSPKSGARMGFMTCLWGFLVVLLFFVVMAAAVSSPDLRHSLQLQMQQQMQNSPQVTQTLKLLDKPGDFIIQLVIAAGLMFCVWTLLSMLGGMIGARLSSRNSVSR
jgi:hypothetical protein